MVTIASDRPIAAVLICHESDMQKVKLSEIGYLDEARDLVSVSLYASAEAYVAVGSSLSLVDWTDTYSYMVASDGSAIYFLDDISEDGYGDLYKITVKNGQTGKPEMLDSDVSPFYMSIDERDNQILGASSVESPAPATPAEQIPQRICPNFGSSSSPSARFCRKCG